MELVLYSKPDCHLCEELKRDLAELQPEFGYTLRERNILDDDALFAQFRDLIPVLEIDGSRLLYPPHDWQTLHASLRAALLARSS